MNRRRRSADDHRLPVSVKKSMHKERIDVIAYSGRKSDERPKTFILRGLRIDVVEIMDSWIEEGLQDRARKRFFRVKGSDKNTHWIWYDEDDREWQYAPHHPKKQ